MQQNANPETPEEKRARRWRLFFSVIFLAGAFAVMILGMVSKVYYDHLTKNAVFSLTQILLPLLVAPMVYGAIYASLKSSTDVIPALILSFQNGFFWQDVFSAIKPPVAGAELHENLVPTFLSSLF
jgi:hypothetical protein